MRFFRAGVLAGHGGDETDEVVQESLDDQSIVFTDKSTPYVDIADLVGLQVAEKSPKETTEETSKWVLISPSAMRRGIYWEIITK